MIAIELNQCFDTATPHARRAGYELERETRSAAGAGQITLDAAGALWADASFLGEVPPLFNAIVTETGCSDLRSICRDANAAPTLKVIPERRGLRLTDTASGDWIIAA